MCSKFLCLFVWMMILGVAWAGNGPTIDRRLLGTKTAYDWATRLGFPSFQENEDMELQYEGRTCTAIHVNMLLRHGSRNPGADDMADVDALVQKIKDNQGTAGQLDFIDSWVQYLKPAEGDMLNNMGKQEMLDIGSRVGKRFKQLLMNKQNRLEFLSSSLKRTLESGEYFSRGISRYLYNTNETMTPSKDNHLLRIHDNCDYFEKTVDDNEDIMKEVVKFRQSSTFKAMVDRIQARLNLNDDTQLTDEDVEYIWEMCAFELMAGRDGVWCQMMSDNDRRVASFANDLEDYYEDSYGNGVSGEIHCVMMKKMFGLMDAAIAAHMAGSNDYTVGSFMFGHSATMMGTITTFRLFHDYPGLSATDMNRRDRKFVDSTISPMAANLGFALYACPNADNTDTKYAVKLFHNERGLELSPFESQVYWYDKYKLPFKNTAKCDIEAICKYPRDTSGAGVIGTSSLTLLISLLFSLFTIW